MVKIENKDSGLTRYDFAVPNFQQLGMAIPDEAESWKEEKYDYFKFILDILNCTPADGWTYENIKKHTRIENCISKAKESESKTATFEDVDYDTLIKILPRYQWAIRHKAIISFIDYINSLKKS